MPSRHPAWPILQDTAIIQEFLAALTDRRTYSVRDNGYVVFGILWGMPVPLVTIGVDLFVQQLAPTPANLFWILSNHPFQIIFLLHPLLFAILFGAMGTVRDKKEQRILALLGDLQAQLVEMETLNAQLRETDRLKDEFLSTISHELKTPLVTVRGYGEMLQHGRGGELDERQSRYVDFMLKNVDKQIHLIDDLLNYVRLGAHPDERDRQMVDLREIIHQSRESFRPSLERKNLELVVETPDEPLWVNAHATNVEIVLSNLLSNAIKFTDPGGEIRVESRPGETDRVLTRVSDTGSGISETSLPHIFERFRQGDGSTRRRHPGTGLGLAIVKKILDSYNCSIEVNSQPGEGTTFCFELPAAGRELQPEAPPAAERGIEHGRGE